MGKTFLGQPDGPNDGILGLVCILLPCVCFPRWLKLRIELFISCFSLFFSYVSLSLPQFFQTPFSPFGPYLQTSLSVVVMMIWWLFMLVGPFWDIFLIRWDPFLMTEVTISKLAPITKWCLASNFLQGTIVTVPFSELPPRRTVFPWENQLSIIKCDGQDNL